MAAATRATDSDIDVGTLTLAQPLGAPVSDATRRLVKPVRDSAFGHVLGVQTVAANTGGLMGEPTLAVRLGVTVCDATNTLPAASRWVKALNLPRRTCRQPCRR